LPDDMPAEKAHTFIAPAIPAGRSLALHLNLISHGRAVCHARRPECTRCILRRRCSYPRI
jgi:endonuclease-3